MEQSDFYDEDVNADLGFLRRFSAGSAGFRSRLIEYLPISLKRAERQREYASGVQTRPYIRHF